MDTDPAEGGADHTLAA
jgi:hypothetical protein